MAILLNSMQTPDGTVLTSHSRHDYKTYKDANGKTYMVDGGTSYIRRSCHEDQIDLTLYDDAPHKIQRILLTWGSYGKDGKEDLHFKSIADMSTNHINAVLTNCNPAPALKNCMTKELELRND